MGHFEFGGAADAVNTIRPARLHEALAIARAHVQADFETYEPIFRERTIRRDLEAMRARWREALEAGDDLLVAEDSSGKIVGLAHVRGDWLSVLYLLADYRRQGIGHALLAELRRRGRRRGIDTLRFHVVAANADAIAFYERQDAQAVGRETLSEGGHTWEDLVFELPTEPRLGEPMSLTTSPPVARNR